MSILLLCHEVIVHYEILKLNCIARNIIFYYDGFNSKRESS